MHLNQKVMRKSIQGKRFGKLNVISRSLDIQGRNSYWLCRCDCGKEKVICRTSIVSGDAKSCGCLCNPPVKEKILSNIEIDENGCWNWKGTLTPQGYAGMNFQGKRRPLHRISYIIFKGEIPEENFACHTCDNRKCVNPDHVYVGTAKTNARDVVNRKRNHFHCGEDHHAHKFTEAQVKAIRYEYIKIGSICCLARKLGFPYKTLHKIIRRKTWNHI